MIEVGDKKVKIPEQDEELETLARGVGLSEEEEVQAAVAITKAVLETSVPVTDVLEDNPELKKLIKEKATEHEDSAVEGKVAEQEARYERFIQEGRSFYEKELQSIKQDKGLDEGQKKQRKLELEEEYKDSIVLEKLVKTEAVSMLLSSLIDPYVVSMHSTEDELLYDPGLETGTSYDYESKTWRSHWDPDVHHRKGSERFLSPQTVEEIQRGLELYFQMRDNVLKVRNELREQNIQEHDAEAARHLIEKYSRDGISIQGRAEVLFGPVSVTFILHNKNDFAGFYGRDVEDVGGFHRSYSSSEQGVSEGIFNVVNASGWYCTDDSIKKTIAHENEHSLNEILVRRKRSYRKVKDIIKKGFQLVRREMQSKKDVTEVSEEVMEQAAKDIISDTAREFTGRGLKRFADEVLAYMLESERSAEKTFKTLTESDLYSYFKPERVKDDIARGMDWWGPDNPDREISHRSEDYSDGDGYDEHDSYYLEFGPELFARFAEVFSRVRKEKPSEEQLTSDNIRFMQQRIVLAVDSLLEEGLSKNEIRAILSGENPARWPRIAKKVTADYSQGWKGRSFIERKKKKIGRTEKRRTSDRARKIGFILDELTREYWDEDDKENEGEE